MLNIIKINKNNIFINTYINGLLHQYKARYIQQQRIYSKFIQKKINDIIEDDIKSSSKKKFRKHSSKSEETNFEIPKKKEKNRIYFNQRTKDIVKNLRLLAINEVKNIRKFFDFKQRYLRFVIIKKKILIDEFICFNFLFA